MKACGESNHESGFQDGPWRSGKVYQQKPGYETDIHKVDSTLCAQRLGNEHGLSSYEQCYRKGNEATRKPGRQQPNKGDGKPSSQWTEKVHSEFRTTQRGSQ